MDQVKIGKFIARKRKERNLTQMELAEHLNITDRAVSKWETGKSLPDASIMLALCGMLKITVNDLLCGEEISMENYNEKMEKNLIEMAKRKEDADRRMLSLEIVIGVLAIVFLFSMIIIASLLNMQDWLRAVLIAFGFVGFLIPMLFAIKIEQVAGYYECRKCGHKYIPTYGRVFLAPHMGRTRYMKCPNCGKNSWQKKVITED